MAAAGLSEKHRILPAALRRPRGTSPLRPFVDEGIEVGDHLSQSVFLFRIQNATVRMILTMRGRCRPGPVTRLFFHIFRSLRIRLEVSGFGGTWPVGAAPDRQRSAAVSTRPLTPPGGRGGGVLGTGRGHCTTVAV